MCFANVGDSNGLNSLLLFKFHPLRVGGGKEWLERRVYGTNPLPGPSECSSVAFSDIIALSFARLCAHLERAVVDLVSWIVSQTQFPCLFMVSCLMYSLTICHFHLSLSDISEIGLVSRVTICLSMQQSSVVFLYGVLPNDDGNRNAAEANASAWPPQTAWDSACKMSLRTSELQDSGGSYF